MAVCCAYCGEPARRSSLGRWACADRRCARAHAEWARAARLAALLAIAELAVPVACLRARAWLLLQPRGGLRAGDA